MRIRNGSKLILLNFVCLKDCYCLQVINFNFTVFSALGIGGFMVYLTCSLYDVKICLKEVFIFFNIKTSKSYIVSKLLEIRQYLSSKIYKSFIVLRNNQIVKYSTEFEVLCLDFPCGVFKLFLKGRLHDQSFHRKIC
jgi:hypothetical protein